MVKKIKAKFIFIKNKRTKKSKWVTASAWLRIKKTPPSKRSWRRIRAF